MVFKFRLIVCSNALFTAEQQKYTLYCKWALSSFYFAFVMILTASCVLSGGVCSSILVPFGLFFVARVGGFGCLFCTADFSQMGMQTEWLSGHLACPKSAVCLCTCLVSGGARVVRYC